MTTAQIINIGNASCIYASNELKSGVIHGGSIDTRLPNWIFAVRQAVEWLYEYAPSHEDLPILERYLISICKHSAKAEDKIVGNGASVNVIQGQSFPIYITSSNFTGATFYPNTALYGKTIVVFVNELNQYLFEGTGFSLDATGMTILLDGFDATSFDYNIIIEKVS
jgi:hypothetical protein